MFWNNLLPSSLKLRLAIAFALLFFISCTVVFYITVYSFVYLENRESLVEMEHISRNIEKIHVMGAKFNSTNHIHLGEFCPREIRENLLKQYPNSQILYYIVPESSEQTPQYNTYYLMRNAKIYEVIQRANGEFSSKEINPYNDRRSMTRYFLLVMGEYSEDDFSIEIRNTDGSLYLSSKAISRRIPVLEKEQKNTGYQTFRRILPDGKTVILRKQLYHISSIDAKYTETFFGILVLVALTGILVSLLIAGRFIRGVKKMTAEMRLVAASGDYGRKISRMQMDNDKEIRELMETYNDMNEKTMSLMEDLKMVSNNVAHDLRTPITRIAGTMESLLRDRNLPEKIASSCVSVAEECLHMKSLINTILDISRVNANPDLLQKEPIDLKAIAEDFCDIMYPEAERKGLGLNVTLPEEQVWISADKMCVQRIISNLVENALKFTEQGYVALSLEILEEFIVLTVSDTGCGISEENLKHVFDRFFRGDASRKYPGNGLGLSLVQAFIKAHNWRIECESKLGEGTKFRILIPKNS